MTYFYPGQLSLQTMYCFWLFLFQSLYQAEIEYITHDCQMLYYKVYTRQRFQLIIALNLRYSKVFYQSFIIKFTRRRFQLIITINLRYSKVFDQRTTSKLPNPKMSLLHTNINSTIDSLL